MGLCMSSENTGGVFEKLKRQMRMFRLCAWSAFPLDFIDDLRSGCPPKKRAYPRRIELPQRTPQGTGKGLFNNVTPRWVLTGRAAAARWSIAGGMRKLLRLVFADVVKRLGQVDIRAQWRDRLGFTGPRQIFVRIDSHRKSPQCAGSGVGKVKTARYECHPGPSRGGGQGRDHVIGHSPTHIRTGAAWSLGTRHVASLLCRQRVCVDYINIRPLNLVTDALACLTAPLIYREEVRIEPELVCVVPVPQADSHRVAVFTAREGRNPTNFVWVKPREDVSTKEEVQLVAEGFEWVNCRVATRIAKMSTQFHRVRQSVHPR